VRTKWWLREIVPWNLPVEGFTWGRVAAFSRRGGEGLRCRARLPGGGCTRRARAARPAAGRCPQRGSVAVQLLTHFAALLCLKREGGGGAGQQTRDADRLAGFFAPAVFAGVDAVDGLLHFLEQLAFAVAGTQFERVFFFDGGAVGRIGNEL